MNSVASASEVVGKEQQQEQNLTLYGYWRSSCSFRVRIALNLKGLKYDYKSINLLKGEQSHPEFLQLNPVGFVPVLVDGDSVIFDSFAIIMYLEDKYPQHPFLPTDIRKRAINFQAVSIVSSSIQPLHNLNLLKYIEINVGPDEKLPWVQSVIRKGFTALEKLLKEFTGRYATGDQVSMADIFLAPQIHAATNKFNIDMNEFPILSRLHETYYDIPAFREALPENQPDAVG
ncbi:unnamed protein product [Vicia faba]|uniref:glutathione transferase n=1 Tax=Vicia faba TaxID=3906 RepID=A0AAV1B340_VICFA|nr:unnamed protein product [Vicia faba]